jgi:hypothetical protein
MTAGDVVHGRDDPAGNIWGAAEHWGVAPVVDHHLSIPVGDLLF